MYCYPFYLIIIFIFLLNNNRLSVVGLTPIVLRIQKSGTDEKNQQERGSYEFSKEPFRF